jgi:hypothetical protein
MSESLELVTALGAIIASIAAVGAWLVAWRTLGGARDQLKLMREQARDEARPYVFVEVTSGLHGAGAWDLVVWNAGRTMARDLTFETDCIAKKSVDDFISEPLSRFLSEKHLLAPGCRVRVMWRREEGKDIRGQMGASARIKYGCTV